MCGTSHKDCDRKDGGIAYLYIYMLSKDCFDFRDSGMLMTLTERWELIEVWKVFGDQMFRKGDFIFGLLKN